MKPIILLDIQTESNIWTLVELPDKVRDSISFQAASLGILEYSFDAGVSYMKTVGLEQSYEVISLNKIYGLELVLTIM